MTMIQETLAWIARYHAANPPLLGSHPLPEPLPDETLDAYRTRVWGTPDGVVTS